MKKRGQRTIPTRNARPDFIDPVSVFHKHHRLFGFILSLLISIEICAYVLLSYLVRIAGGGAAPSPLHPPTRFYFLMGFPCYLHSFLFS
jgi:hypothetical protein